jgi:hypothetical protein
MADEQRRRIVRRKQEAQPPEPVEAPEATTEAPEAAEEDQEVERQDSTLPTWGGRKDQVRDPAWYEKVLAKIEAAQENVVADAFEIGDAIYEAIGGPPGDPGPHNGTTVAIRDFADWLLDQGIEDYSERTLDTLWRVAAKTPASLRGEGDEAGVSWSVYKECCGNTDLLHQLISCIDGKKPRALARIKTSYRGRQVSLPDKIQTQSRITVEDAKLALGRKTTSNRRECTTPSSTETREEKIERLREELADEDLTIEVLADRQTREIVSRDTGIATDQALDDDPEEIRQPRPRGVAARTLNIANAMAVEDKARTFAEGARDGEPTSKERKVMATTARKVTAYMQEVLSVVERGSVADEATDILKGGQES